MSNNRITPELLAQISKGAVDKQLAPSLARVDCYVAALLNLCARAATRGVNEYRFDFVEPVSSHEANPHSTFTRTELAAIIVSLKNRGFVVYTRQLFSELLENERMVISW